MCKTFRYEIEAKLENFSLFIEGEGVWDEHCKIYILFYSEAG